MTFEQLIYTGNKTIAESPYMVWLRHCTEKHALEDLLRVIIPGLSLARTPGKKTVLDIGCSWGETSMRLMRILRQYAIDVDYYALDPYAEQLAAFRDMAAEENMKNIHFLTTPFERAELAPQYDLVFVSHALYYVPNMKQALEKVIAHAKEVVIVHHGMEGIHRVHQAFREYVQPGAHIVSTYWDVGSTLQELHIERDCSMQFYAFPSHVDVACCATSASEDGKKLISFFLERPYDTLPGEAKERVHQYFYEQFPEGMTHDVGVFVLRRIKEKTLS